MGEGAEGDLCEVVEAEVQIDKLGHANESEIQVIPQEVLSAVQIDQISQEAQFYRWQIRDVVCCQNQLPGVQRDVHRELLQLLPAAVHLQVLTATPARAADPLCCHPQKEHEAQGPWST